MKVVVTGARGQLAGAIIDAYKDSAQVLAYSHQALDIGDFNAVMSRVEADRPDIVINCAAFNNVDLAEDECDKALTANAFAVRVLARSAQSVGAALVHYSTDFVFDGRGSRPYTEEDTPNPQSVYAQSKVLGEWFALEAPRAYVLRVASLFGGANAKSSIDRIAQAILEGRETKVFHDRTISPSYTVDVAAASKVLVERGTPGLYHCVGSGHATWHAISLEIARILRTESQACIVPISVAEMSLKATRPQFAALANDKLAKITEMPPWQDALRRYLAP